MKKIQQTANSSKFLGCAGGLTTGTATHGTALVRQVLTGFDYDYDPASRRDREEDIRVAVAQLVNDVVALRRKVAEHTETYPDGLPEDIAHTLITLLSQGYDWSRDLDVDYSTYLDEIVAERATAQARADCYQMRLYYGREPRDYHGSE